MDPPTVALEACMHPALNRNLFLVKEHLGLFKAANNFDIYDPANEREDPALPRRPARHLHQAAAIHRLQADDAVRHRRPHAQRRARAPRPPRHLDSSSPRSTSSTATTAERIGGFKQKFFSIGGAFTVLDANDQPICQLKGKWTGWDFRFMAGDHELAHVSKKWAGIGKEMFTTADNYILEISEHVPPDSQIRQLILAAVLCIDMVLKE